MERFGSRDDQWPPHSASFQLRVSLFSARAGIFPAHAAWSSSERISFRQINKTGNRCTSSSLTKLLLRAVPLPRQLNFGINVA
jgi:hypothetical protein